MAKRMTSLPWPQEQLLDLEAFARVMIDKHRCDVGPIETRCRRKEWADIAHWLKLTGEQFTRALKMEEGDPQGLDKMATRLRKEAGAEAFSWMENII